METSQTGMNQTPSSERIHIGIFGKRNAGKSSLINAITKQETAIVSEVRGTTTDPVYKAMELQPLGPVVLIDTPGLDDEGELGRLRVQKALSALRKTDAVIFVADKREGLTEEDRAFLQEIQKRRLPCLIVYNKNDICEKEESLSEASRDQETALSVSARTGEGIEELKKRLIELLSAGREEKRLVGDILNKGDLVVLVVPIDKAAPKGRLILPQQQAIRDILESGAAAVVTRDTELRETLSSLGKKPALVITDSQVFGKAAAETPEDVLLTSFSILFARYKGNLWQAAEGAQALELLEDGDKILISEGCTHHRQCEDIGTVKLPRWIREYTGKEPEFCFTSGTDFPEDLSGFRMVVHCGGCMLNEKEMQYRFRKAAEQGTAITNYGILIAHMKGILKRSLEPFLQTEGQQDRKTGEIKGKEFGGPLYRSLLSYSRSDFYGFHMPGHKRQTGAFENPFQIDITEIEGFDDLHHPEPEGILTKAQERAARLFGAEETHFLVNGSTSGILSAVSACTHRGGKLLMARNCHRSVYHGAELMDLTPVYSYPKQIEDLGINGAILPEDVDKLLNQGEEIEAVLVTSPTYDGICSDVRAIAEICHSHGVPLIVDQAHGAHFPFSDYFPEDAVSAGADIVIHSVHKTLPALTQTALLHVQGELVNRDRLRKFLSVYQSSSPSYVLMASIDALTELLEKEGQELFENHVQLLERFRMDCRDLRCLFLADEPGMDRSKLLISGRRAGISGKQIADFLLEKYHLQMEMTGPDYVIGISGIADTEEGFQRLKRALHEMDEVFLKERENDRVCRTEIKAVEIQKTAKISKTAEIPKALVRLKPGRAAEMEKEVKPLSSCAGSLAAEYVYLYPPGIPLMVPGEEITEEMTEQIERWLKDGFSVHGLCKSERRETAAAVLKEEWENYFM